MARTRRVGNRRSQAARGSQANEESAVEEIDIDDIEEVDIDDDSGVQEVQEEQPAGRRSGTGRRSRVGSSVGGASGRRSARVSARSSTRSSARRSRGELTPEEIEAKRKGRKALLNLFLGLILLGGVGYGIFWGLQPNPLHAQAEGKLNSAKQSLTDMENALNALDPKKAQTLYDQAGELLRVELFGYVNGEFKINEDDPRLASPVHAKRAHSLLEKFDEQFAKIDRVEKRVKAEDNLKMIMNKLNNMKDLKTDEELDHLERLIKGYRENPLDPELGDSSPIAQEEYSTLIARLTGKEQDVIQERKHRIEERTVAIQNKVNSKVSNLLGQERFQAALDHIEEQSKKWPEAQLDAERDRVNTTAKEKWDVAKKNAASKYADGISSTNNFEGRKKALKAAIDGMANVVDKYGIDDYVREAKELKTKYERALRNLEK